MRRAFAYCRKCRRNVRLDAPKGGYASKYKFIDHLDLGPMRQCEASFDEVEMSKVEFR